MTSINRIDQAILLLKDRLQRLQTRGAGATAKARPSAQSERTDPLVSLRQVVRQGRIGDEDLRQALVRTLLADSLGEELVGSLEFQAITQEVSRILEDSESGRALLDRALAEL